MEINRNNYEAYLLDQVEGNLSVEDQQKLRDFLTLNPDCALLQDLSELWILEEDQVIFSGKEALKKEWPHSGSLLTESNFDLFSIARMEGDLTASQEEEHKSLVDRDQKKSLEWERWQLTRLVPSHVEYREKKTLKKSMGIRSRVLWVSVISAAAAAALIFTLLRMDAPVPQMDLTEETPGLLPQSEVRPSETEAPILVPREEEVAAPQEPRMFSIKKQPGRPVESVSKGSDAGKDAMQDSVQFVQPGKIKSRPVRLASYEVYGQDLGKESTYDQIKTLDIPPSDIHLRSLSLAQIPEIDLQDAFDQYTEENNISLFSIAKAGIKGINKLTGADISLMASTDEEGEISGYRLKSKRFSLTRPVDRSE